jgi:RNA polymerase sigma factor (sigma-70 family)
VSPPTPPSSAAVVRFSSETEAQARWFRDEVQPHENNMKLFLRHRFPRLRDVDDVVHDTYLKLIREKAAGNVSSVRGFLFTSLRNAAYDFFRRKKSHGEVPIADSAVDTLPLEERDGAESAVFNEELQLAAEAVEALPVRCREVMKLRKVYGMSYREIADQLGIEESTVSNQLMKGYKLCREYLARRGIKGIAR